MSIIDKFKKYVWNLFIALDQFVNAIFGGDPDETISSRVGKDRKNNLFAELLSRFLDLFEKDHVEKSREDDEGKDNSF